MTNELIPFWKSEFSPQQLQVISEHTTEIIFNGPYVGGDLVRNFEKAFEQKICSGYPISVANGLQALEIALVALSLNNGKRIAVPSHTFIATWLAVLNVGSTPVAIDTYKNGQMDLDILESLAGELDAVIPVHMHGAGVDMDRLMLIAEKFSLKVVEDVSQAHGLVISNKKAGEYGDAGAFSLYPTKNIGAFGDAGIIVFRSEEVCLKAQKIANYGSEPGNKYIHKMLGTNSRLDPIQTPVLQMSINNLETSINTKRDIAKKYLKAVAENEFLTPLIDDSAKSTWHHFVLRTGNRKKFTQSALENMISTDIHYPNCAAKEISEISDIFFGTYAIAEKLANEIVSLPIYSKLLDSEIDRICDFISSYQE